MLKITDIIDFSLLIHIVLYLSLRIYMTNVTMITNWLIDYYYELL